MAIKTIKNENLIVVDRDNITQRVNEVKELTQSLKTWHPNNVTHGDLHRYLRNLYINGTLIAEREASGNEFTAPGLATNQTIEEILSREKLVTMDNYNNRNLAVIRLTDYGKLFCLQNNDITENAKLMFSSSSLVVLNPDDFDSDDRIFGTVGVVDNEILIRDWEHIQTHPEETKTFHREVRASELLHATHDEIFNNLRKDW